MLRIFGGSARDCDGLTRRSFLQAGALGLGGLALPDLLRLRAEGDGARAGAEAERHPVLAQRRARATWRPGTPSPTPPTASAGPFGAIPTSVPGVHFGELMPEQARRMDRLAILRTVNHGTGDHTKGNHWMLTGYEGPAFNAPDNTIQRRPSIGSAVARLKAPGRPGMPAVRRRAATSGAGPTTSSTTRPTSAAAPTRSSSSPTPTTRSTGSGTCRLPGGVTLGRLEDRRRMLAAMDQLRRDADPKLRDLDAYRQRAFAMLDRPERGLGLRHRRRGPAGSATSTAATPSARAPCWPAAWSRRARRS